LVPALGQNILPKPRPRSWLELKPPRRGFSPTPRRRRPGQLSTLPLSPGAAIAMAARVKLAGKDFVGDQRELYLSEEQPGEEPPYERLLSDAMAGDGALFAREDQSKPPGRWSSRSLKRTIGFVPTSAAVGGRKRPMGSSRRTVVGITQIPSNPADSVDPPKRTDDKSGY